MDRWRKDERNNKARARLLSPCFLLVLGGTRKRAIGRKKRFPPLFPPPLPYLTDIRVRGLMRARSSSDIKSVSGRLTIPRRHSDLFFHVQVLHLD